MHSLFSIRNLRFVAIFGSFLLLISVPSCKKSGGKVAIHGHVSYRGEALERASLTFFPDKGRPETTAVENGAYATDLLPGDHTVVVLIGPTMPQGYKEGDPLPLPKIVLPDEYTSRSKSTLKASVKAGQDQPIDFDLK